MFVYAVSVTYQTEKSSVFFVSPVTQMPIVFCSVSFLLSIHNLFLCESWNSQSKESQDHNILPCAMSHSVDRYQQAQGLALLPFMFLQNAGTHPQR